MKLFLSPHPDDETLFGAYIIMNEKPLVVIITDSYEQFKRGVKITAEQRIIETKEAMKILGAEVEFLRIKDTELMSGLNYRNNLIYALEKYYTKDVVYAPAVDGCNEQHDFIGEIADELFDNVIHYVTYKGTKVKATEEMKQKKLKALGCYKSQIKYQKTKSYFTEKNKDEYIRTSG